MDQKAEDLEELPSENLEDRPPIDLVSQNSDKKADAVPIIPTQNTVFFLYFHLNLDNKNNLSRSIILFFTIMFMLIN